MGRSSMPSGKKSCFQHITKGLCTLTVLAAIGVAAWHFLGRPETPEEALDRIKDTAEDIEDALGNLTDSDWIKGFNDDPFVGDNSTYEWPNNGQGLSLELWNALDETWQTEFQVAVDDWQESPALQLSTRQVDVDPKCSVVDGIMKVCNDNYGATGWLGESYNWVSIVRISTNKSQASMRFPMLRQESLAMDSHRLSPALPR